MLSRLCVHVCNIYLEIFVTQKNLLLRCYETSWTMLCLGNISTKKGTPILFHNGAEEVAYLQVVKLFHCFSFSFLCSKGYCFISCSIAYRICIFTINENVIKELVMEPNVKTSVYIYKSHQSLHTSLRYGRVACYFLSAYSSNMGCILSAQDPIGCV